MESHNNRVLIQIGEVENTCFVVMPLDALFQIHYERVIRPAIEGIGLRRVRGDEIYSKPQVMADIWKAIRESRLVIADLTGRNSNVFYEVGLAHAIGKPTILLTRNEADVPFDLKALRYRYYDVNDPFWGENLSSAIQSMIQSILNESQLATYLEGIETEIQVPDLPKVEGAALQKVAHQVDISGIWQASIGDRFMGPINITQQEVNLSATFTHTHYHHRVLTVVQEAMTGIIDGSKVLLNGTSYTYIVQGDCPTYGLDAFDLELGHDYKKMTGEASDQYNQKSRAAFIKLDDLISVLNNSFNQTPQ